MVLSRMLEARGAIVIKSTDRSLPYRALDRRRIQQQPTIGVGKVYKSAFGESSTRLEFQSRYENCLRNQQGIYSTFLALV